MKKKLGNMTKLKHEKKKKESDFCERKKTQGKSKEKLRINLKIDA